MVVIPNLHFNGNCEKALRLYEKVFSAKIIEFKRYKDSNPNDIDKEQFKGKEEYVYHAEMMIGSQRIMLNDSIDAIPFGINVSMLIAFDSVQEVKRAYELLKDVSEIIRPLQETTYSSGFVSLVDRYGVRWELMKED